MRLTYKYKNSSGYGSTELKNLPPDPLIDKTYYLDKAWENQRNKLGQLEDIEDELGIDLVILFKALSCGAWEKQKDNVLNFDNCKLLYKRIQIGSNVHWLSNYGKTWALTKEELE